jgi:hypothetical protein
MSSENVARQAYDHASQQHGTATPPLALIQDALSRKKTGTRYIPHPQRTASLSNFLSKAERRIQRIAHDQLLAYEAFTVTLEVLEELLELETGSRDILHGCGVLLHRLWGGSELKVLTRLYNLGKRYTAERFEVLPHEWICGEIDRDALVFQLRYLIQWYGKRNVSLLLIEDEHPHEAHKSLLFGMRVLTERKKRGEIGIELVCGARLSGLAGAPLWLRVEPRISSNLAGDHTMIFEIPFTLETNREILDEVKVFIPYRALHVDPGHQTIELGCSIVSSLTGVIATTSHVTTLMIPAEAFVSDDSCDADRSDPATRGLWEEDPASRSALKIVRAVQQPSGTLVVEVEGLITDAHGDALALSVELFDDEGFALSMLSGQLSSTEAALSLSQPVVPLVLQRLPVDVYEKQKLPARSAVEVTLRSRTNGYLIVGSRAPITLY